MRATSSEIGARMNTVVTENADAQRFEISVDGKAVGHTAYSVRDDVYVFTHTEIDPAYEGHGLGSTLIQHALDEMRARGAQVVPRCPFVREFIETHEDYADLVARSD